VALNQLVPELTREMVERIFATDLEDWPAILRALRETGEGFRKRNVASSTSTQDARPEDSSSRRKVQRVTRH
jgi:hypothetical protein